MTDGAHPPVRLGLATTDGNRPVSRSSLTTRGVDPQLFVQWPDGTLTWLWARAPLTGMRRLTVSREAAPPPDCIARNEAGGEVLAFEAIDEDGQRTCLVLDTASSARADERRTRCVPVGIPHLVGRPLAEARSILAALDLTVGDLEEVSSREPNTVVVVQEPAVGSAREIATGDPIHLVVSRQEMVAMPSIVGRLVATARDVLAPLSLDLVASSGPSRVELDRVLDYQIDSQDPESGVMVPAGSQVASQVALRLPELLGQPVAEAVGRLRASGLRPVVGGAVEGIAPDVAAAYTVAAQRPDRGEPALFGQEVFLEARTPAPDLGGLSPAAASRLLAERGLRLRRRSPAPADAGSERVRSQRPPAGDPASPGAAILVATSVLAPEIEGATVDDARARLATRGLRLAVRDGAASERLAGDSVAYRLAAQQPPARASVATGTAVAASLEVEMPNLRWRDPADAEAVIQALGLDFGRPQPRMVGSLRRRVVGQQPAPGSWLPAGSQVLLILGPGLDPPLPEPRWPWLWLAVIAALASLLRARLRRLPRGLKVEGHTDFGNAKVEAAAGSTGPPAFRLRPHWDAGRQTIVTPQETDGGTLA